MGGVRRCKRGHQIAGDNVVRTMTGSGSISSCLKCAQAVQKLRFARDKMSQATELISSEVMKLSTNRPPYAKDSACRYVEDPEIFFPVGTAGPALVQIREAKAVCSGCPVRSQCLEWAMARLESPGVRPEMGIWGGTTEDERKDLLRSMRRGRIS